MNAQLVFLACGWLVAGSDIMPTSSSLSPEAVVQSQVDAYNARNLEAFLATYTDAARLYEWPEKLLAAGTAQLRERYASRFADAGLHADILQRIVVGNLVVDHEKVRRMFPEGPGTLEAIAIYEVENGKIAKAWLRLGERRLDRDAIR